ncbi:MAG: TraR/DksA family transcriptional regulator [Chitinophagia bacterium]|jgi:RNA polymerase-binding transcription factor DksA|nr:TraR/DksA family transcriptional regulator [Chitinophagia bacterium]NCA29139.1 TraR/DksA family transcriptional regulator [Chitinophagia bacterium]NDD15558.1 TraR/DksA family transcriptional regulator [Chitinophagia bacterium]
MPTKKPAHKKAAPAKKAAAKKTAPAKKPASAKKAAPKKAAPKKVAPKKAAPKKSVPAKKKVAPKKKAAPVKKVVSKKAAPLKKVVPAKAPSKKAVPVKAPAKPIIKPVAKPVEKYIPPVKPVPKIPTPPVKPVRKVAEPIKDIKVPKIGAKTSVPYQPGYVPMEKRKEVERSTETLVKYSDAELNEFKDLISKKLDAAKKELVYLQGIITRKDELGGDNDDARYMTMEDGSVSMEREQLGQMASRQITFIDHLEKALMRIENKTYGICRVTGRLIDKARLRAVPHATLSLEAKLGYVKNSSDQ